MKISKIGLITILILVIVFSMVGFLKEGLTSIESEYVNNISGLYNKKNIQNCTDVQAKDVLDELTTKFYKSKNQNAFLKGIVSRYEGDSSINNVYSILNDSIKNYKKNSDYSSDLKNLPLLIPAGGISPSTSVISMSNNRNDTPDRQNNDRPNADRPTADRPNADRQNADRPNADRPNADRQNAYHPTPNTTAPIYDTTFILKNDIDPLFSSTNQLTATNYNLAYNTLQKMHQDINKIPTPVPSVLINIDNEIVNLTNSTQGPGIYRESTALLNRTIATLEPTASRPPLILPSNYA